MNTHSRIFKHLFHKNFLTGTTYVLTHKVSCLHPFFYFVGNHVPPVTSGKSHDKSEITFLYSGKANGQVFLYVQRNIVFGILCRFSVLIRIDTEKGKVAGVTRPHPVVSIRSKFSNRRRRGTYHTNVAIHGFYKQIIFISSIKGFEFQLGSRSYFNVFCFCKTFCYFVEVSRRQIISSFRVFVFL